MYFNQQPYPGMYGGMPNMNVGYMPPKKDVKKPSDAFKATERDFGFNGEKLMLADGTHIGTLPFRAIKNTVYDSNDKKIGRVHHNEILLDYANTYFIAGTIDKRGIIRIKDKVCNTQSVTVNSANDDLLKEILLGIQNIRSDIATVQNTIENRKVFEKRAVDEEWEQTVRDANNVISSYDPNNGLLNGLGGYGGIKHEFSLIIN